MIAVFAQVNSLPGAQIQPTIRDWNRNRVSQHSGFQMGGHIIGPFIIVLVIRLVFGDCLVEKTLKVSSYRWVGVLVNSQASRRMLNENVQ